MASNIIALDIGEKRIGVAIADMQTPFPAPLITFEASEHLATEFASLLKTNNVAAVVIGFPRNQKGEATQQTERVQHIAKLLKIPDAIPVYWQDESLTSVKAEEELKRRKKPYAKAAVDSLAATYILEDFIRTQASGTSADAASKSEGQPKKKIKKKQKNRKKHTVRNWIILTIITLLGAIAVSLIAWYTWALGPRTSEDIYTSITISSGTGSSQIAAMLEERQVIKSAKAFSLYVKLNGVNNLQAGQYRLSSKQPVKEIVEIIEGGKVTTVKVLISPGQRLDQILTALQKDGYSKAELETALEAVRDHPLLQGLPADASLEGYLFPDTYQIGPATSADQLFRLMLDNFNSKLTAEIKAGIAKQGLTLRQAVTLASIVQKEIGDPEVQPTVAQVFLKRYKQNIMLGSDVTALYGAQVDGVALPSNAAQAAAVAIAHVSPYNTRKFTGIPPGAISNFNFSALSAVAFPSNTDYLYFVAGDNGTTYFSNTLEEHEAAVKEHCIEGCG